MQWLSFLASIIVSLWGLVVAKTFLVPILMAALLAFMMAPFVRLLRKNKIPEWLALTFSGALLFLPVFLVVLFSVKEVKTLIHDFPSITASLKSHLDHFATSSWVKQFGLSDYLDMELLSQRITENSGSTLSIIEQGLKGLAQVGTHILVTFFFSILMLACRQHLRLNFERIVSKVGTLDSITVLIEKFLIIRLGIAVLVALVDIVVLKSFGSRYVVLFGSLLGVSTLIPVFGFIVAIIPPAVVSISMGHSSLSTITLLLVLYLISSAESHFVTPKYLGSRLNLNLLATFLAIFAGESIWGLWGMLLSVPLLGVLRIALESSKDLKPWAALLAAERNHSN